MPEPHLTRQAILDPHLGVFGYRIQVRAGDEDLLSGLGPFLQRKKAFLRMSRVPAADRLGAIVPPAQSVIEIDPDPALLDRCRELKKRGALIATGSSVAEPFRSLADIVKVDFRSTAEADQAAAVKRCGKPGVRLLAEGVESPAELDRAKRLGYALFEGPFIFLPQSQSRKELPAFKLNYLRILQKVSEPEIKYEELDGLIRQDLALSLKLLRYVNSAMFALPQKVESIRQALALVGISVIRRWVSLLALVAMCEDKPQELISTSLVRARFCEQIGPAAGLKDVGYDLFMAGLLSAVDAILDRPMHEVLHDLPLSADVKAALLGKKEGHGRVLGLALAYERADWDGLPAALEDLTLDLGQLPAFYREAVAWTAQIFVPR